MVDVENVVFPPRVDTLIEDNFYPVVANGATILSQDNQNASHDWLKARLNKIDLKRDNDILEAKKKYLVPKDEEDAEIDDTLFNGVVEQIEANFQELVNAAYTEYREKLLVSDSELSSSNEYKKLVADNNIKLQSVTNVEAKKVVQSEFIRRVKDLRETVVLQKVGPGIDIESYLVSQYANTIVDTIVSDRKTGIEDSSGVIRHSDIVRMNKGVKLVQRSGQVHVTPVQSSANSNKHFKSTNSSFMSSDSSASNDLMQSKSVNLKELPEERAKSIDDAELASRIDKMLSAEEKTSLLRDVSHSVSEVNSVNLASIKGANEGKVISRG
jgi:arsenate reductase-like glutaredoxin family protein